MEKRVAKSSNYQTHSPTFVMQLAQKNDRALITMRQWVSTIKHSLHELPISRTAQFRYSKHA